MFVVVQPPMKSQSSPGANLVGLFASNQVQYIRIYKNCYFHWVSVIIMHHLPAAMNAHVLAWNPQYAQTFVQLNVLAPFIILLQCLSDTFAPPIVVVTVAIVAVSLSYPIVATAHTIVGLEVLKPQPSWLPIDTGGWTSAASPPSIS